MADNDLMRMISQISNRVRSFVMQPAQESKRTYRFMRYWVMFTWFCTRELKRDNATQIAAALTYRTMFSLLPMLVLALVILQAFRGLEGYQAKFKQSVITFLLPEQLLQRDTHTGELVEQAGPPTEAQMQAQSQKDSTTPVTDSSAPQNNSGQTNNNNNNNNNNNPTDTPNQPTEDLQQSEEQSVAQARALLGDNIEAILNKLEKVDFGKIGWVGLLVFMYGATTLLVTAEKSFNVIFDVEQGRPWYQRLSYYLTMIILGPIFIIIGQVAQQRLMSVITEGAWTNWLAGPSVVIAPIATTWLVLLVMFLLLPHTKVQIRCAALGSLVAALFWVGTKELFAIYATRTGATSLYGALALVPLFLLWVYLTWLIVLFGLEIAYVLQAMKSHKFQREITQMRQHDMVQSTTMLNMLALIADGFEQGQVIRSEQLSERLGITPRLTRLILQELEKAHWIHKAQNSTDGVSGYSLAQPTQKIPVAEVLRLGNQLTQPPSEGKNINLALLQYLKQINDYQVQKVGSQTLADVIANQPAPTEKDDQ